ncbi:MAG: 30S ribosome-binding factor RbfA [Candidatus Eisenbacteria bacterium]
MRGNRMGRVDEEVRREIGAILQQKARDPRLAWVSVTRAEVSRDLSVAQVFVSTLGDEDAKKGVLEALVKAGPFVRAELGRRLRLRRTPELRFQYDPGIEHSLKVNRMLEELGVAGADVGAAGIDIGNQPSDPEDEFDEEELEDADDDFDEDDEDDSDEDDFDEDDDDDSDDDSDDDLGDEDDSGDEDERA